MPRRARDLVTDPGPSGMRRGRDKLSAADLRQMTVSEFTAWLSGQTNKQDRPFQEHTMRGGARRWRSPVACGQPNGRAEIYVVIDGGNSDG